MCFPEKINNFTNEDQPWLSKYLKGLDRKRKRIYSKERRSTKWQNINRLFKREIKRAKKTFYKSHIEGLKQQNPSKWYSSLKRISSYDTHKYEKIKIPEICHLSETEQTHS